MHQFTHAAIVCPDSRGCRCRVSNDKAQRHLHRLSRRSMLLLREPSTAVLASAARAMGFADLQQQKQEDEAHARAQQLEEPAEGGKKRRGGKKAAEAAAAAAQAAAADITLAEPATAVAIVSAVGGGALLALEALPAWSTAAGAASSGASQLLPLTLAGTKYAAHLPRLTRRFSSVAAEAVAAESAAAGAAAADELAGAAAERALALRSDVAKGAKSRKKKALTGALLLCACMCVQCAR